MIGAEHHTTAAVVLAGGLGTRLSDRSGPKPARLIAGKPLLRWVVEACLGTVNGPVVVVVPPPHFGGGIVIEQAGEDVIPVVQEKPLGTGDAFLAARYLLERFQGELIVTVGDVPALQSEDLINLLDEHRTRGAALTLATAEYDTIPPYGRVVRDADGNVEAVVEEKDASPFQRQIREVTTSQWVFRSPEIWPLAAQFKRSRQTQEMYLTDIVALAREAGLQVAGWRAPRPEHHFGVNTPEEFAEMENYLIKRQAVNTGDGVHELTKARSES